MSVAQETPLTRGEARPGRPPQRNGRWSGYSHLLMARLLELKREPEVVFWVFVFPLLLALGLGIAFRNKPGDAIRVAMVAGTGFEDAQGLLARSPQHELFKIQRLNSDDARKGFRLGKFDLVIEPDGEGGLEYRYDPARPESVLAKAEVNDALQFAAGRKDVVATKAVTSSEPGSRYIDFLIPGLLGMNLMNSGMWGIGFALAQAAQEIRGDAYAPRRFSAGDHDQPLASDDYRNWPAAGVRRSLLSYAHSGVGIFHCLAGRAGIVDLRGRRPADREPRAED